MTLKEIYYFQTNLMCILVLLMTYLQFPKHSILQFDQKLFKAILMLAGIFCVSDAFSTVIFDNHPVLTHYVLYVANMVFYISSVVISYGWAMYTRLKVDGSSERMKKFHRVMSLPMIAFTILVATTPWTGLIFTISADNVYERGSYVFIHWIVSFGYMIYLTVITLNGIIHTNNRGRKAELAVLLVFVAINAVTAVIQAIFYGVTLIGLGITVSALIVYYRQQNSRISLDALTGINNRGQLDKYLEDRMSFMHQDDDIMLIMIDVDHFKSINDRYGHLEGDNALIETAELLKHVCNRINKRMFLARYGGDEFVIASSGKNMCSADEAISEINESLAELNKTRKAEYDLQISMGYTSGKCKDFSSLDELIGLADKNMYKDKISKR